MKIGISFQIKKVMFFCQSHEQKTVWVDTGQATILEETQLYLEILKRAKDIKAGSDMLVQSKNRIQLYMGELHNFYHLKLNVLQD